MVIFTGVESDHEFEEKRTLEYQRNQAQGTLAGKVGIAPPIWLLNFSKVVGFTAIFIGLMLLVLTLTAYFS
jgi:hypothetical protein